MTEQVLTIADQTYRTHLCISILLGARFSEPVQTGSGAHPASYAMGTGSLSGVKRPGRGVDLPPSYLAPGSVAYPGILFGGGGSTNSVEDRGQREWGSGGR